MGSIKKCMLYLVLVDHKLVVSQIAHGAGGDQQQNLRHEVGGGVFRVTPKTVSFTIVLLGGHLQDLTN